MNKEDALAVFENYRIRRSYDEKSETWFFSVIDIMAALIQQPDYQAARNYWKVLKNRLKKEGSQTVTNCNRLKLVAEDYPDPAFPVATLFRHCRPHFFHLTTLFPENRLDPGNIPAHLRNACGVFQMSCVQLKPEIEQLLIQFGNLAAKIISAQVAQLINLHCQPPHDS